MQRLGQKINRTAMNSLRRHIMMQQAGGVPTAIMGDSVAQISLGMSIATFGGRTNHLVFKILSSTPIYKDAIHTGKGLLGAKVSNRGSCVLFRRTLEKVCYFLSYGEIYRGDISDIDILNKKCEGYITRNSKGSYNGFYKPIDSSSYSTYNIFNYSFENNSTDLKIWANGIYLYELEVGDMLLKPWIENGEVGLMDINSNTFHGNDAGAGSFTAIYE